MDDLFLYACGRPILASLSVLLLLLLPATRKMVRDRPRVSGGIVTLAGAIAFFTAYALMLPVAISLVFAEHQLPDAQYKEVVQEASRASWIPFYPSCDSQEQTCIFIRQATMPVWIFNSLHVFALVPTFISCLFVYMVIDVYRIRKPHNPDPV